MTAAETMTDDASTPLAAQVGARIREVRLARGLTQKQLADLLDVSHVVICRYESGERFPSLARLTRLCDILRLSPNLLLGWYDR